MTGATAAPPAFFTTPRVALITGGSRGIGHAIAGKLEAHGCTPWTPGRAELDLGSAASVRAFIDEHRDRPVDILVNNAGINTIAPFESQTDAAWSAMLQINLLSAVELTRAFGRGMVERRWGRIIHTGSILATVGRPGRAPYSTTKSALAGLTRALAVEWSSANVLTNLVSPGFVDTELTRKNNSPAEIAALEQQIPLRRLIQPGEIAELVLFLASEKNTAITGQDLIIDGGFVIQ